MGCSRLRSLTLDIKKRIQKGGTTCQKLGAKVRLEPRSPALVQDNHHTARLLHGPFTLLLPSTPNIFPQYRYYPSLPPPPTPAHQCSSNPFHLEWNYQKQDLTNLSFQFLHLINNFLVFPSLPSLPPLLFWILKLSIPLCSLANNFFPTQSSIGIVL